MARLALKLTKNPRKRPVSRAFTPFQLPDRPPTGTYDPSIDAQQRGVQRGFQDVQTDAGRQRLELGTDTTFAQRAIDLQAARSLSDLLRARERGGQDFAAGNAARERGFARVAQSQTSAAQRRGVLRGGTLAAALAARNAEKQRQQAEAQQTFERFLADNSQARGRVAEDQGVAAGRLGVMSQRQGAAIDTTEQRAGRESVNFGLDANAQRWFQAGQMGVQAPQRPANEFVSAHGVPYRVLKGKKRRFATALGGVSTVRPA